MRNDKHLAITLRKSGKSYKEISKELEVPKSTLSEWLAHYRWSKIIKKRLNEKNIWLSRQRLTAYSRKKSLEWARWREEAREEARQEFPALRKNPLFVSGLMLYWGEGDSKPKNPVRMANTDPRMIEIYAKFLKGILHIPAANIRGGIILYDDLDVQECKNFWSKIIGIPLTQFHKHQIIKGRHPTKRLTYGICLVTISSRRWKEKFLTWIDLFHKTL